MALNLEKQLFFVSLIIMDFMVNGIDVFQYGSYHHDRVGLTDDIQCMNDNLRNKGECLYSLGVCSFNFNDLLSPCKHPFKIQTAGMR